MRAAEAKFHVALERRFEIPQQLDRAEPVLDLLSMFPETRSFPGERSKLLVSRSCPNENRRCKFRAQLPSVQNMLLKHTTFVQNLY
jgi:hypothetical protein